MRARHLGAIGSHAQTVVQRWQLRNGVLACASRLCTDRAVRRWWAAAQSAGLRNALFLRVHGWGIAQAVVGLGAPCTPPVELALWGVDGAPYGRGGAALEQVS